MSNPSDQRASSNESIVIARLALTMAICFCAGGLYGWSALVSVIESVFSATTEQAALVFSISIVAFSLAVFAVPRFSTSFTGLSGCALFGMSGAGSLVIASLSNSYGLFLCAFSLGFGFSSGAIYINALTIASGSKRPTRVTAVMVAIFSLGGAVFGPLWRVMVSLGWQLNTLLVLAGTLALCALVLFATSPAIPIQKSIEGSRIQQKQSVKVSENRVVVLLLWLSFALGSAGGLIVLGLASKIIDIAGGTVLVSSAALAGIAIGNTLGRLSVGVLANVVSPMAVALMSTVVVSCGLIVSGLATSAPMSATGLICTATGYGLLASAMPTLVLSLFGKHFFAQLFSIVFTAWGIAGLLAPWIAGVIFDNTGSFAGAILIALIATAGACLTLLILMVGLKQGTLRILV